MRRILPSLLGPIVTALIVVGASVAGATAAEPYDIDVILPLTGPQAFLGQAEANSLTVLQQSVNQAGGIHGRPVHFLIQDDQSIPQIGVQIVSGILAKHPAVILGPSMAGVCSAVAPLMVNGPVNYCFTPGIHPPAGSWVFSGSASSADAFKAASRYFRGNGWKKIAVIASTDASGQDGEIQLDSALSLPENSGLKIVDREHFNLTDISVSAQMSRIKQSGAQVLVAWSSGTPTATVLRASVDVGLDIPIMSSGANLTYAQMKAFAPIMPRVLFFAGYPVNAPERLARGATKNAVSGFIGAFKATGIRPDIGQAAAWDPAMIVIEALRRVGTNATPQQLKDYISNLNGWVGVLGPYDFRAAPQRGLDINSQIMVRWDVAKDTWIGLSEPGGAPLK